LQVPFHAAHRLHAATLSEAQNATLYGKCNNLRGHGHRYLTETTIGGDYDARSGTLYDFVAFRKALEESLEPWRDRHLDLQTEDLECGASSHRFGSGHEDLSLYRQAIAWPRAYEALSDHRR